MKGVLSRSITGSSHNGGNFSDGAEAPQRLLGHRMVVATSAYLGIEDEDAADVAMEMVI
jgi:integrase